jgi:hypothetical protein
MISESESGGVIQLKVTHGILCAKTCRWNWNLEDYYHGFTLYIFLANVTCIKSGCQSQDLPSQPF